ncbi:hypothetical protein ACLOJK_012231 [Asimina triloba]
MVWAAVGERRRGRGMVLVEGASLLWCVVACGRDASDFGRDADRVVTGAGLLLDGAGRDSAGWGERTGRLLMGVAGCVMRRTGGDGSAGWRGRDGEDERRRTLASPLLPMGLLVA